MKVASRKSKCAGEDKDGSNKRKRLYESPGVPLVSEDAKVKRAGKAKVETKGKRTRKQIHQALSKMSSKHFVKVDAEREKVLKRQWKLEERRELVLLRKRDKKEMKLMRSKPKDSAFGQVEFAAALGLVGVAIIVKKEKN